MTEPTISIDVDDFLRWNDDDQEAAREWLRDLGGDPNDTVSFDVYRDHVTAHVYARDADDQRYLASENEIAKTTVKLPLTVPPPDRVRAEASVYTHGELTWPKP